MLSSIPIWVYLLFFGLLYLGIRRCVTSTMKLSRLIILPAALLWLSLDGLWHSLHLTYHSIWIYVLAIIIGCGLGLLHVKKTQIRADKIQHLIEIPGDWTYLILIMAIFIINFAIHYVIAVSPSVTHAPLLVMSILFISGLVIGLTIGRNGCYLFKFMQAPHVPLTLPHK